MHNVSKTHPAHYLILALIGLGIWVPVIGVALCLYVLRSASGLGMGGPAVVGTLFSLLSVELAATVLLLIYAFRAKPWRRVKSVRMGFYVHALGAGVSAVLVLVFVFAVTMSRTGGH
ncbi:hypothetical protein [Pseudomonas asturiensis]|nr:hypothetical protein [Pseudomonas asturiensis]